VDMTITLTLIAVFACVALLTGSVATLAVHGAEPGRRRIKQLLGRPTERVQADAGLLANAPNAAIKRISSFVPKSPKEMSRIQRRLALAGFHETKHTVVYVVAEVVLTIIGFVVPVFLFGWAAGLIFGVMGAIVGYILPSMVVDRKMKRRQKEIENGLPPPRRLPRRPLPAPSHRACRIGTAGPEDVPFGGDGGHRSGHREVRGRAHDCVSGAGRGAALRQRGVQGRETTPRGVQELRLPNESR